MPRLPPRTVPGTSGLVWPRGALLVCQKVAILQPNPSALSALFVGGASFMDEIGEVVVAQADGRPYVTPVNRNDEWATPVPLANEWIERLALTWDGAASFANRKLPLFWSKEQNALSLSWAGKRLWINPPWSSVGPWVDKALQREAEIVCLLLPARTDTAWFRKLETDRRVFRFFLGRVAFLDPESRGRTAPREGAMIAVIL